MSMPPGSRGLAAELRHLWELAVWLPKLAVHRSWVGNLHLWSGSTSSLNETWLQCDDWLSALLTVPDDV